MRPIFLVTLKQPLMCTKVVINNYLYSAINCIFSLTQLPNTIGLPNLTDYNALPVALALKAIIHSHINSLNINKK